MVDQFESSSAGSAQTALPLTRPPSAAGKVPIRARSESRIASVRAFSPSMISLNALSVSPDAVLLIHASIALPPHDVLMMPIGTWTLFRISRAKK